MKKVLLTVSIAAMALTACSNTASYVSKEVHMPANVKAANDIRSLALLGVEVTGSTGEQRKYSNALETFLTQVEVNGNKHFKVIGVDETQATSAQIQQAYSKQLNGEKTAELGKKVKADTLLTAKVDLASVKSKGFSKSERQCQAYRDGYEDNYRSSAGSCMKYTNVAIQCVERIASVELNPVVIDAASGQVILDKFYQGVAVSRFCPDSNNSIISKKDLQNEALTRALIQFRLDIAPYTGTMSLPLNPDNMT